MVFRKLEIAPRAAVSGCRAALVKAGRAKEVSLQITLAGRIREEMGLGDGEERFAVQIGEFEHHGILRIRKAVDDAEVSLTVKATRAGKGSRGGYYHRLKLGHQPQFRAEPAKPETCKWEQIEDGWFEIVLPPWADETAPKRGRVTAVDPKILKAKAAGEADKARQERERREAEKLRRERDAFGDAVAFAKARASGIKR